MKTFLGNFGRMLHDLFTSKKFTVAVGGTITAIAKGVPAGTAVLAGAGAYVLGQGMADFGKNANPATSTPLFPPPKG